jgi:hypothetical protein
MRTVTLLLLALLLASATFARPMGPALTPDERQAAALLHEAQCYRVLNLLDLTPKQKAELLPMLREHIADMVAIRETQAKQAAAAETAMCGLRTTVYTNNGVPDAVKAAVGRAEGPYSGPKKKLDDEIGPERALQVWELLTTSQGARVRRLMRPEYIDDAVLVKTLAKSMPLGNRGVNVQALASGLYITYGLSYEELPKALAHGMPVMKEWSLLSQAEAAAAREEYISRLLALPERGILVVKREPTLPAFLLGTLLTQKTLHALDASVPLPPVESLSTAKYITAEMDVQVMNLVNTLYLSPQQTRVLIGLQEKAVKEYGTLRARRLENVKASLPVLTKVRDAYAQGATSPNLLTEQMLSFTTADAAIAKEEAKLDAVYLVALKQQLTENQVAMVANFVPCTVPVQSLTNPERVGQASDNTGLERSLAKLRDTPERQLQRAIADLQNSIVDTFKHKHRSPAEAESVAALIPEMAAEIRLMDDTEFAMKKTELAEKLAVPEYTAAGAALDARIVYYLLAPNLTPILKSREGAAMQQAKAE